ncbi:MAG: hypothetical protein LBJ02_11475 [Bifidobacteriaceae bacterium]|jgi:hypothetical protein|nr:hypothetical protein [Bifidobacteriaceae bacterium]
MPPLGQVIFAVLAGAGGLVLGAWGLVELVQMRRRGPTGRPFVDFHWAPAAVAFLSGAVLLTVFAHQLGFNWIQVVIGAAGGGLVVERLAWLLGRRKAS